LLGCQNGSRVIDFHPCQRSRSHGALTERVQSSTQQKAVPTLQMPGLPPTRTPFQRPAARSVWSGGRKLVGVTTLYSNHTFLPPFCRTAELSDPMPGPIEQDCLHSCVRNRLRMILSWLASTSLSTVWHVRRNSKFALVRLGPGTALFSIVSSDTKAENNDFLQ
jgi:hypothetical protein